MLTQTEALRIALENLGDTVATGDRLVALNEAYEKLTALYANFIKKNRT